MIGKMRGPDLNAMALFARVLQHGSFSEAARRAGMPVSTLSRRIAALEAELGIRLLERTTRRLKPTEAGRAFLVHCQEVLEAGDGAQAMLASHSAEPAGILRLATVPSLSDVLIVPLIHGFLRRYPKVRVKVLATDRHLDMVDDEVDVSLRVGVQADSGLLVRRLLRYRHVLVASPAYLAAAKPLTSPVDLSLHPLLGFSNWFGETTWTLSKSGTVERAPVALSIGINDYAGVLSAATSGMGIAEVPSILCQRELALGRLALVMPEWEFAPVDLAAYYLSRRHGSRIVELFLNHCSANAEKALRIENTSPLLPTKGR